MDQALKDLGTYITTTFKEIENIEFIYDELVLTVSPLNLNELLQFLRSDTNCQFKVLIDICGADYPQREKRFEVIYNLLSMSQNQRVRVKVMVDENTPVPTSTNIYSAASWFEREAWDCLLYTSPSQRD